MLGPVGGIACCDRWRKSAGNCYCGLQARQPVVLVGPPDTLVQGCYTLSAANVDASQIARDLAGHATRNCP